MLKLLGKPSSINVRKVLWLCEELSLAIHHEAWGSGHRPTDTPEFLALNPNGQVPVIVDDEAAGGPLVLWESNSICRYLAAREGRVDLLPAAPVARARVEQWMDWQATDLNSAWRYAFMAHVRRSPAHTDAVALAGSEREWNRLMALLDAQLVRSGAFVTGPTFTLADIVLGLSAVRWTMTPMDRPDLPGVQAWLARLAQRPGFQRHGANGLP